MPAAEVVIDVDLVRRLLRSQHPDLADLPIVELTNGWDNAIYRLGDELTVRLPRRSLAADLVRNEQRWLPMLADRLPLPIPAPVRAGEPEGDYPWAWSVCPWFAGDVAGASPPRDLRSAAAVLGGFLAALHRPAPEEAPDNRFRGGPLDERDESTLDRIAGIADLVDVDVVRSVWRAHVGLPPWTGEPRWLHGDLHPANLVVRDGELAAVIDFGDLTSGDPATDLAVAWMLFASGARTVLRAAAGEVDDATWARARGWALSFAVIYVAFSADHPVLAAVGRRTLDEVIADAS